MNEVKLMEEIIGNLPEASTQTDHFFTTGIYTRQMTLQRGSIVVGKAHRDSTLNILLKGKMAVYMSDHPNIVVTFEAPCAFESNAGVTKAVYCEEDCIILNVHRTDQTDLEKLEEELINADAPTIGIPEVLGLHVIKVEEARCLGSS